MSTLIPNVSAESTGRDTTTFPLDHVTRAQLAKLSGKSEMFWIRLERARKGPPITRLGKTPLYGLAAVKLWMEAQSQQQKTRGSSRRRNAGRR